MSGSFAKSDLQLEAAYKSSPPCTRTIYMPVQSVAFGGEVGGWGRVPFSKNLMSPTPRRKWYLTTGRRAH